MSATEVIEQIKSLPPDEQAKVAEFLRNHAASRAKTPECNVAEEFKKAADQVFTKNAELFRKLAQ